MSGWAVRLFLAVVAVLALSGASSSSATVLPAGFEESTIAHRLIEATDVDWAPDGRLFVAEKAGRVQVYGPDGTRAPQPVVDISDHVLNFRDRGLTGIAVDRDFAANGYLYLLYTYKANPGDTEPQVVRLSRVVVQPDNTLANPGAPETVILGTVSTAPCPPLDNTTDCIASDFHLHQGGTVRSDPVDGSLWVGFGDDSQFDVADPHAFRTYDERSFAGKILHIDRDGHGLPGHPFCPADANLDHVCTKVHAKGFRNPFRFTLRGGVPLAGDVGSRGFEEIDLVRAGDNYGWPCYEGNHHTTEYAAEPDCAPEYAKEGTPAAATPPVYEYSHNGATASITGGPTYDADQFPADYLGAAFFGDYVKGTLEVLRLGPSDELESVQPFGRALGGPVDIEVAPDGSLAVLDIRYGALREIRYVGGSRPDGGMTLAGCVAEELPGCDQLEVAGALDGLNGLAISRDGRNLYAVAIGSGTLNHFSRKTGGELGFLGCISSTVPGCTSIAPADAMAGTHTVALSPDGSSAYTASDTTGTVERFDIEPVSGAPSFAGCIGRNRSGCSQLPVDALRGAHTALVSQDGRQVYVSAVRSDSLVQFDRDPGTGALQFVGCQARSIAGCTNLGLIGALNDPHDAKLSPDGAYLYAPGYAGDSIARFERDGDSGTLTFVGCIGQAAPGCTDIGPIDALDGVHGVAISPDGADLYGAAGLSGTVSHFRRDESTGELEFAGCIGRAAPGCAAFDGNALEGAHWVTVSPDGRSVYVAARESSAIARFARDPATGDLTYVSCVAQGAAGCRNLGPIEALGGEADWVQLSPDSRDLYVTSFGGDGLSGFHLDDDDAAQGASGALAGEAAGVAVTVRILRLGRLGKLVGTVHSAARRCEAGVKVLIRRALRGPDDLLGKGTTDPSGRFRVRLGNPAAGGRLYALVKARTLAGGEHCNGGRSTAFRARAYG